MKTKLIAFTFLCLVLSSCSKYEGNGTPSDILIGTWEWQYSVILKDNGSDTIFPLDQVNKQYNFRAQLTIHESGDVSLYRNNQLFYKIKAKTLNGESNLMNNGEYYHTYNDIISNSKKYSDFYFYSSTQFLQQQSYSSTFPITNPGNPFIGDLSINEAAIVNNSYISVKNYFVKK